MKSPPLIRRLWRVSATLLAGFVADLSAREEGEIDFNRDIRPILSENCFYCHGQDANKRKADLRMDEAESAHALAIDVAQPDKSPLLQRIQAEDSGDLMPPPESNRRLTEVQKTLLHRWIENGGRYDTHWAFVAPVRPSVPDPGLEHRDWARHPIDAFVAAKWKTPELSAPLSPSPEADWATLIRRLSIDLIGQPPEPEEVDAFVADPQPGDYEALVDRLLASPHYGERMALPWLDAARYADSNGFQQDGDTWQWMWRDWVVEAMNRDLPFDQFSIWQLAGDLLPGATVEQKIASGFNRNHLLNGEGGAIPEEQRFVNLFDRIDTTTTTWLGLTMACAQCHDHKYDPITMRDYYGFMDAFNRVPETGTPQRQSARIRVAKPFLELPTEANRARLAEFEARIAEARKRLDKSTEEKKGPEKASAKAELERLKRELADYRGDQIPRPMVMSDEKPRDTHILDRGAYLSPLEKLSFATPAFLPPMPEEAPRNRLGLAEWLFAEEHPLTARVQVNRIWQHFFGTGIVKTSEDFGVQSEFPIHGELLDWLAVEFRERGWSVKWMHRHLVTGATYRQTSRVSPSHLEADVENRYFARASRSRMPAMLLRDVALAASGLLDRRISGAPVYPYQPENVWEPLAITKERDFTYPRSSGADLYRRSLYTFWRRTVGPANMFDASSRQACRVRLSTNNTPLHALTTLNGPTWVEAARGLAARGMRAASGLEGRLEHVFRRVMGRSPSEAEGRLLERSYRKQQTIYREHPADAAALLATGESERDKGLDATEHAAFTAVCLALYNVDEALSRE